MTESDWLTSDNPQKMLDALQWSETRVRDEDGEYSSVLRSRRRVSDRKLRLFVVACAGGPEAAGDWNEWAEREDQAGEFLSLDGALYFTGQKIGQHHPYKLQRGEKGRQADLLRDIFGNPYRSLLSCWQCDGRGILRVYRGEPSQGHEEKRCPECLGRWLTWRDGLVVQMPQQIHDGRDFAAMPILADALEEAGCQNEAILRHCRGQEPCPSHETVRVCDLCQDRGWMPLRGPHVRGCWVLDLILGKE